MNGHSITYPHAAAAVESASRTKGVQGHMPFLIAMTAAAAIFGLRFAIGGERFIGDEALRSRSVPV